MNQHVLSLIMKLLLQWLSVTDTAGNRHVARRYHYVQQGTTMKEHVFEWIGTKYQLADTLTKAGTPTTFGHLWSIQLSETDTND